MIEAKIGADTLNLDQIQSYVELAKLNNVDSLITVSNQFSAFPGQHPVYTSRDDFHVYHFSWMHLVTIATLLLSESEEEFDGSTLLILKEMLRFFSHTNIDVRGFNRMTPHWERLISGIKAGRKFRTNDIEILETAASWQQEEQDLCLMLSRNLGVPVSLVVPRNYRDNHLAAMEDDTTSLVDSRNLAARFSIPNAAGSLDVWVDIGTRTINCSMTVKAPEDRRSYEARLNWLIRQLPEETPDLTYVRVKAQGIIPKQARLSDLREDSSKAKPDNPNVIPTSFRISVVSDLGPRFAGRKTFIESLEKAVPDFYDGIVKHIKAWVPPPPPGPATRAEESLEEAIERISDARKPSGKIIKSGTISGRRFVIFENGSIQVETREGLKLFPDFGALRNFVDTTAPTSPSEEVLDES